jgi:gliding motility-associated-like protein
MYYENHLPTLNQLKGRVYQNRRALFLLWCFIGMSTFSSGQCWEKVDTFTTNVIHDIHFISQDTGFIVGSGILRVTHDGGYNWQNVQNAPSPIPPLRGLTFLKGDKKYGWAVGGRKLLYTTNKGITWNEVEAANQNSFNSVYFSTNNNGWIVGDGANTFRSTGSNLSPWGAIGGAGPDLRKLFFINENRGWVVGDNGRLLRTDNGSAVSVQWGYKGVNTTDKYRDVFFIDENIGWVAGQRNLEGLVLRTMDGGENWDAIKIPSVTSLQGVQFINKDTGWVVGWDGAIYRTDDGGINWNKEDSGTDSPLLSVFFFDAQHGWAVGYNGTIIKYKGSASLNLVDISVCQGDTVTLSTGFEEGAHQWRGPNLWQSNLTNPVLFNNELKTGIYSVTVTTGGCAVQGSINVIVHPKPDLSPQGGQLNCSGEPLMLSSGFSQSGATYKWEGPQGFQSSQANPSVVLAGTYYVTVTSGQGCKNSEMVTVDPPPNKPLISYNHPEGLSITCFNPTITLNANAETAANHLWLKDGIVFSQSDTLIIQQPGAYTFQAYNDPDCKSEVTFDVTLDTISPAIKLLEQDSLTCDSTLSAWIRLEDIPNASFHWTLPGGGSDEGHELTLLGAGEYTVTVKDTINGCFANTIFVVDPAPGAPEILVVEEPLPITCERTSVEIMVLPIFGVTYNWISPLGSNVGANNSQTVNLPGLWKLTVVDTVSGCSSNQAFEIIIDTFPPILENIYIEAEDCQNGSFILGVENVESFKIVRWTYPDGNLSNQAKLSLNETGNYLLEAIGQNGCISSLTIEVTEEDIRPAPQISAVIEVLNCNTGEATLSLNLPYIPVDVIWKDFQGTVLSTEIEKLNVNQYGLYYVEILWANGCKSEVEINVEPLSEDRLPTVITPNGDGRNDRLVFDLCGEGNSSPPRLTVFNRWGQKVYHADAYNNDWPTAGSLNLPTGQYYYILEWNNLTFRRPLTVLHD